MQKARCHPTKGLQPLVSAWFQVLFHSAVRGSFHLSLTVLVHYRSLESIQPYRMVPADSHKASPTSWYSGYCYLWYVYIYGTITPYGASFQKLQFSIPSHVAVLQPRYCLNNNGLGSSLFARHYLGNHYLFSLPPGTQMFQFPGFAPIWYPNFIGMGLPIRKSSD